MWLFRDKGVISNSDIQHLYPPPPRDKEAQICQWTDLMDVVVMALLAQ